MEFTKEFNSKVWQMESSSSPILVASFSKYNLVKIADPGCSVERTTLQLMSPK